MCISEGWGFGMLLRGGVGLKVGSVYLLWLGFGAEGVG